MNNLPRVAPESAAAGSRTRDLLIASQPPSHTCCVLLHYLSERNQGIQTERSQLEAGFLVGFSTLADNIVSKKVSK